VVVFVRSRLAVPNRAQNLISCVTVVDSSLVLPVQTKIRCRIVFKSVTTLLAPLPNMSTKTAAHQKKVESAVQILKTTTGVKVRQAMILANFSKNDIANDSIRRTIQRRIEKQSQKAAVRLYDAEKQKCNGMSVQMICRSNVFYDYFTNSIMSLYPDAAPVKGRWVVVKCNSGHGQLNPELLAYIRFHGFILYPGVPNTTAGKQETDQSYGPFQSAVRMLKWHTRPSVTSKN